MLSFRLCCAALAFAILGLGSLAAVSSNSTLIPVRITLSKASVVTLVIEDAHGKRVRNLVAETKVSAGTSTFYWDAYDDGEKLANGDLVRHRVPAGSYIVRGLTHEGIKLYYELSVNNAGNPPWHTNDHSGAWMADHSSPYGAVFLPKGSGVPQDTGQPQVLLSALVAETGDPLILVNMQGQKVYGTHAFGWDGGMAVTRDMGTQGRQDISAYVLMAWENGFALRGMRKIAVPGQNGQPAHNDVEGVTLASYDVHQQMPREPAMIGLSVAVYNNLAVVSVPLDNVLVFIDCQTNKVLGTQPMPAPKGLAFDQAGTLYVITDGVVKRFGVQREGNTVPQLRDERPVITTDLVAPYSLTVADDGTCYVSDWGNSNQVKVFDTTGRLVRTIGKAGGIQVGLYDEQRMHRPDGLTLDDQGRLWIAEADYMPKRISVWKTDGTFIKGLYGPPHYGGGGTVDPTNRNRLFYGEFGGMLEFAIDWTTGTSKLVAIPIRQDVQGFDEMPGENWFPEYVTHAAGHTYLIGTYQGALRGNNNTATFLYDETTHTARPVSFVGSDRHWSRVASDPAIKATMPNQENEHFMTWSDLNNDGKPQANEFKYRLFDDTFVENGTVQRTHGYRFFYMNPDLSLVGVWTLAVPAPTIRPDGVPIYDIDKATFLMDLGKVGHWAEDGDMYLPGSDHWLVGPDVGFHNGEKRWTYPIKGYTDVWEKLGDMIDPTRVLGPAIKPGVGEAGEFVAWNGEKGSIYLMTTDGLFIQDLGGDMRRNPLLRTKECYRGMRIEGISFEDEHFHPTMTKSSDGKIYLVAGKEDSSIFRVEGFGTVKRVKLPNVSLTTAFLARLPETQVIAARKQGRQTLNVAISTTAPIVDGQLKEWPKNTEWATIDARTSAALTVSNDRLYGAFKTNDAKALINDGGNYRFLFKKGGAIDLMLGTNPQADMQRRTPGAGDLRLLMTRVGGVVKAVLYRAVVPGTPAANRVLFESPIGKVYFDQVVDVSTQVRLVQQGGNIEFSVPLTTLGVTITPRTRLLGDLGILRGDGVQTIQRAYWNNLNTTIVSDIPSEATLQPGNWGLFKFTGQVNDNVIVLKAENAKLHGTALRLDGNDIDGYHIGYWSNFQEFVEWTGISVPAGTYQVDLVYGCGQGAGGKFMLKSNGQTLLGTTTSTGGDWANWTTMKLGELSFPGGPIELRITPTDPLAIGLMDLQCIMLTPVK